MRGLWDRVVRAGGGDVYPGDGAARIDVGSLVTGVSIRDIRRHVVRVAVDLVAFNQGRIRLGGCVRHGFEEQALRGFVPNLVPSLTISLVCAPQVLDGELVPAGEVFADRGLSF